MLMSLKAAVKCVATKSLRLAVGTKKKKKGIQPTK